MRVELCPADPASKSGSRPTGKDRRMRSMKSCRSAVVRLGLVALLAAWPLAATVQAQLTRVGLSEFSDRRLRLPISLFAQEAPVGGELTLYGVAFVPEAGVARLRTLLIGIGIPPLFEDAVLNDPLEGTSAGKELLLRFHLPLRRVGFVPSNGSEQTQVTIRAESFRGEFLGSIELEGIDLLPEGPFVGFETDHPDGIGAVSIDYGDEENGEQLTLILLDYLSPPSHRLYFPQVAVAAAGDLRLSTVLQVQTLPGTGTGNPVVEIRFFDPSGAPLGVRLDGEPGEVFRREISSFSLREFVVEPDGGQAVTGYAYVESPVPVLAQTLYRVTQAVEGPREPRLWTEAGVPAAEAGVYSIFSARTDPAEARDVAIALVNLADEENNVRVPVFEGDVQRPPEFQNPPRFTLAPGEQRSFFLSQLCRQSSRPERDCRQDFPADRPFSGTVEIVSSHPLAVAVLSTIGGLPLSSLPAGSLRR